MAKDTPAETDVDEVADSAFNPSVVQANRSRQQGLGVGAKELDLQRDPTGADSSEHHGPGDTPRSQ